MTLNTTPMKPGSYLYSDPIGGAPQRIEVRRDGSELVAWFEGLEGDEGAEIPVQDMCGDWAQVDLKP